MRLGSRLSVGRRPSSSGVHGVMIAVLCAGGCVLASCGGGEWVSSSKLKLEAPVHYAGFSLLSRGGGTGDAIPDEALATLKSDASVSLNREDIVDARRVLPSEPAWLVPAGGGDLCLVRLLYPLVRAVGGAALPPAPVVDCASQANALAGKLVTTQSLSATSAGASVPIRVIGVVPDGVNSVTIGSQSGSRMRVDVLRNGYVAVLREPTEVIFVVQDQGRSVERKVRLVSASLKNGSPVGRAGPQQ